jgi:hypothetical protein
MTKKNLLLLAFLAVLAVVYGVWFSDWFRPSTVGIYHTNRSHRTRRMPDGVMPSLIFALDRPLKLTELRVVPLDAWQTNHNVLPLWHLVASSNAVPIKTFFYGQFIRGLKPAVVSTRSQPLAPQVNYRLIVTAGKITGQHDFHLEGEPAVTP